MTINIKLSEASILRAIHRLNQASDNLRWGVSETIEELIKEGATIANADYGGMATAIDWMEDETVGKISAVGDQPIIAEFGAGDATIPGTGFENPPATPTYPGSYSESDEGSGMYAEYGWWKFGGRIYTEVEPRSGLLDAKNYIIGNAVGVAKEVIEL